MAAENSFSTLKALNPRLTPTQINAVDAKGNTALYYAIKNRNIEFIEYLLARKADLNIKCSRGMSPLHLAFKSSDYSLICKCLTAPIPPDLNLLDDEGKTPLFFSNRRILEMLGLETGVVMADTLQSKFDNNKLLRSIRSQEPTPDNLEHHFAIKRSE